MRVSKTAAALSLASALTLVSYGPAGAAPLTSASAAAKLGAEQTDVLQVRWHRGLHVGGANTSPYYYGGSYLGSPYGGFAGYPAYGCSFPCWGPYGWYRPYYFRSY